jgi:agmatinase
MTASPLTLGGDHTLTLPILRAMAKKHGPVALIHVDAHADINDEMFGEKIAHGTPFRRAVEEGLLAADKVFQIGLRGSGYSAEDFDWPRQQGFVVVTAEECWNRSLAPLMETVRAVIGSHPVYLTFDIDSLDPAFAPGTGTVEIAGLTTWQALEIIRGCRGLNLVGGDLVEVSPPYDPSGNTALIGANLLFEMLCVLPGVAYPGQAMKVCVLGGGVIGIATAYYLAEDGHEVTVVDRHGEAASETSYGNAGLVSPGDSYAWASPDALRMLVKSLYRRDLGISVKPSLDPAFLAWTWRFLLECRPSRPINTLRKLRIALYSRHCINAIEAHTGIDYDARKNGIVYFHRTQASLDHGAAHMRLLADNGLKIEVVDRERLVEIEPALAPAKDSIAGAIYSPMDQTGDSAMFSRRLAAWLAAKGTSEFAWLHHGDGARDRGRPHRRALTDKGPIEADAFVLAWAAKAARGARRSACACRSLR